MESVDAIVARMESACEEHARQRDMKGFALAFHASVLETYARNQEEYDTADWLTRKAWEHEGTETLYFRAVRLWGQHNSDGLTAQEREAVELTCQIGIEYHQNQAADVRKGILSEGGGQHYLNMEKIEAVGRCFPRHIADDERRADELLATARSGGVKTFNDWSRFVRQTSRMADWGDSELDASMGRVQEAMGWLRDLQHRCHYNPEWQSLLQRYSAKIKDRGTNPTSYGCHMFGFLQREEAGTAFHKGLRAVVSGQSRAGDIKREAMRHSPELRALCAGVTDGGEDIDCNYGIGVGSSLMDAYNKVKGEFHL